MSDFWSNISPQLAKSIGVVATTLLAWWVIVRIGRRAAARVDPLEPERQQRVATLWQAGRRVITILLGVIVLLMLMSIWDVPITPLLAVGSAVGLAVEIPAIAALNRLESRVDVARLALRDASSRLMAALKSA